MAAWLRKFYYRIGIHAAPPGTFFHFVHSRLRALAHRRLLRHASGDVFSQAQYGGTPYYDIARIRSVRRVDGLALIFFMGLGDYLFTTPVIEALRVAYPGLLIYAFASTATDAVNSSLVADMLRTNRYVDAVFTYRGRTGRRWLDYDFRDCLKDIPKDFIILPMVYSTDPAAFHRVTSLFETFQLPVRFPVPAPILEANNLSPAAAAILTDVRDRAVRHSARSVVCCHFGTRSSDYLYPHRDELISSLAKAGHVVVSLSATGVTNPRVVAVDVGEIMPNDTIELLRHLRADDRELYVVSVNSVMWPISAGLEIANLGLHIFRDESVHQYVYPNIFVITQHLYPRLSPGRLFVAPDGVYKERATDIGTVVTDFDAKFVLDCFARMTGLTIRTTPRALAARSRCLHPGT